MAGGRVIWYTMEKRHRTEIVTIRTLPAIKKELTRHATAENTTISQLIEKLLAEQFAVDCDKEIREGAKTKSA